MQEGVMTSVSILLLLWEEETLWFVTLDRKLDFKPYTLWKFQIKLYRFISYKLNLIVWGMFQIKPYSSISYKLELDLLNLFQF